MASAVGNLPRARDGGRELAELETVKAVLGQEFTQKEELALVRENHGLAMCRNGCRRPRLRRTRRYRTQRFRHRE
ncbi:MAG: hypothetical protein LBC55_00320 [Desulfovibrio sp.]|nr:hypothetical protein [Desulfovibrio sp.]